MTEPTSWRATLTRRPSWQLWVRLSWEPFSLVNISGSGLSQEDIRKYVDPKNIVSLTFTETSPDCLEIKTTMSNLPDFNNTVCLKLGERNEMKAPFEWALTMTKKCDNKFVFKT